MEISVFNMGDGKYFKLERRLTYSQQFTYWLVRKAALLFHSALLQGLAMYLVLNQDELARLLDEDNNA